MQCYTGKLPFSCNAMRLFPQLHWSDILGTTTVGWGGGVASYCNLRVRYFLLAPPLICSVQVTCSVQPWLPFFFYGTVERVLLGSFRLDIVT